MLVMSRKANESITVNGDIIVTVVDIRGDKVRLGIQAPREASVHRSEVLDAISRESDDPYRTVIQSSKEPPVENFDTVQIPMPRPQTTLRIDRERPLESLKSHLRTVLGEQQFEQVRPLLEQLGESKGISVK